MVEMDQSSPPTGRLGNCVGCEKNPAKYKCPKCATVSCSLDCVHAHKESDGCDGVRNKSSYVALNKYSNLDLISDYKFLESASRRVDSYARDRLKRSTRQGPDGVRLPRHLVLFKNACYSRGKCRIRFLPPHFDRHKTNSSKYHRNKGQVSWKVRLEFPHSNSTIVLDRVDESTLLYDLVSPQVEPPNAVDDCESVYVPYQAAGYGGISVCLKVESLLKERQGQFYEMDLSKTLVENLMDKTIVEHPIIVVFLAHHTAGFSDGFRSSFDKEALPAERNADHSATANVKTEANVNHGDETASTAPPSNEVYKNCYDYYLNYYNEKYGVQESSGTVAGSVRVKEEVESEEPPAAAGEAMCLVSYSDSDGGE